MVCVNMVIMAFIKVDFLVGTSFRVAYLYVAAQLQDFFGERREIALS